MSDITLTAQKREGNALSVRESGFVPAVMYGHELDSTSIQVNLQLFTRVLKDSGESSIIELSFDGDTKNVLIKELQRHPVTDVPIHIDFYAVRMDEKITTEVPLEFEGESAAVKEESGILVKNFDALEVEALPADLPEKLVVDISSLATFEDQIIVSDISLPNGVTVSQDISQVVATVSEPRSEEELDSLDEVIEEDVSAIEGVEKETDTAEGEEAEGDKEGGEKEEPTKEAEPKSGKET